MRGCRAVWMLMSAMALAMVGATGARAQTPPAPTLVITDSGEPHAAIIRFDRFATSLSASVRNPPQSTTEATITGPRWTWSGGTSAVRLTLTGDSPTNGLDSGYPPEYGGIKGLYSVTVRCSARFTRTVTATGAQSFVDVSGSKTVRFFIRWPEIVFGTRPRLTTPYNGQPLQHPTTGQTVPGYGHTSDYDLQVQDNQDQNEEVLERRPYGNSLPREQFAGFPFNGPLGGDTFGLNTQTGTGTPLTDFTDTIGLIQPYHPPVADWWDVLRGSAAQGWHAMEYRPMPENPYVQPRLYVQPGRFGLGGTEEPDRNPVSGDFLPNIEDTHLGTHSISGYWGYTIRRSDDYPYLDTRDPSPGFTSPPR